MSTRELVILGTASQAATRERNPNGYALKWDDKLFLFDHGEGFQRQCILAGVAIARADALFVTHLHGDHCLGLPGVVHRRILDRSPGPLPTFFPMSSEATFDRLMAGTLYTEAGVVVERPIAESGPVWNSGELTVSAQKLQHPVPTFGYRLDESDSTRLDGARLEAFGIRGAAVGELERRGHADTARGRVDLDDFLLPRPGQSMAIVMDTSLCDEAIELAAGVDLLLCEATYLDSEQHLARPRGHMTAREAGWLAREAGVRRVVLSHFSQRYRDARLFAEEAGALHDDVIAATDLMSVPVPRRSRSGPSPHDDEHSSQDDQIENARVLAEHSTQISRTEATDASVGDSWQQERRNR